MGALLPYFDAAKEYQHAGMIDWLTLKIDTSLLSDPIIETLRSKTARLCKISPDGAIDWTSYCWESVRSDTHQVCVRLGSEFHVQGSPARIGLKNNVFGSLDIRYCANKMINLATAILGIPELPQLEHWTCSRIDITRNFLMQSGAEARQAIEYLKQCPEGRQKHSFESYGLYVGKGSSLHRAKFYLKGQDARRNSRLKRAVYTDEQLLKSDKLLRAEYTIARHKIRRLKEDRKLPWHELTPAFLLSEHEAYIKDYLSDIEVTDMSDILERLISVAPTEGRARAAYDCYNRIRTNGYYQAKESYTYHTWRKHISYLRKAGFKRVDLQSINIIPLRKRAIELSEPVRHWDDIPLSA